MNYIDLLLSLIFVACIWVSTTRGFILSSLVLISWIGSLIIGFLGYSYIAWILLKLSPSFGVWAAPLGFFIAVIIGRVILDKLEGLLLHEVPERAHNNVINKILGVVPGVINGYIWATLLATLMLLIPFTNSISQKTRDSKLASALVNKVSWLDDKMSPVFSNALNHTLNGNGAELGEEKSVKLPFTKDNAKPRPDLEAQMLILVNKERTSRGLNPVKADPEMTVVARKHSVDMFVRGYFSHYTPEGTNPFGRMKKGNITFITAGENLALAQTLSIAHKGLMNSPGHKANILNPSFGRLGIGILDGGIYGLMITQDFRN
ncbi:CvpA family protein [Mucilaginibacter segetis]|uniref:CvpA family protein n=1 Tax=Mucilaginibacter segetis TaxID=2793071 RepID=A0A934UNV6_9SPHI|nr:CvpA family protein [Mucilaginibacter segetis]MBK0380799.1 CvpA family protein [Mucilaginibacter segetis]